MPDSEFYLVASTPQLHNVQKTDLYVILYVVIWMNKQNWSTSKLFYLQMLQNSFIALCKSESAHSYFIPNETGTWINVSILLFLILSFLQKILDDHF